MKLSKQKSIYSS